MINSLRESLICRLCGWEDKDNLKLSEVEITLATFKSTIVVVKAKDLIASDLNLNLDDEENLPSRLCSECKTGLQNLSEFLIRIRQGQDFLRKIIKTNGSKEFEKVSLQNVACSLEKNSPASTKKKRGRPKKGAVNLINEESTLRSSNLFTCDREKESRSSTCDKDDWTDTDTSLDSSTNLLIAGEPHPGHQTYTFTSQPDSSVSYEITSQADEASKSHNHMDDHQPNLLQRDFDLEEDALNIDESRDDNINTEHLETESSEKVVHKCDACGTVFPDEKDLLTHFADNHKVYICHLCKSVLVGKLNLNAHRHKFHPNLSEKIENLNSEEDIIGEDTETKDSGMSIECGICLMTFESDAEKTDHVVNVHGQKQFCCDSCDRKFASSSSLYYHIKTHQKEGFNCPVDGCQKKFSMKSLLKRHLKLHDEVKPYSCSKCDKNFKSLSNLRQHEKCHNVEKLYQCEVCGREFKHKCSLNQHTATHTGDKKFACTYCKKKFYQRGKLTEHLRVHTGEKRFGCEMCNKSFKISSQLKRHQQSHSSVEAQGDATVPSRSMQMPVMSSCNECGQLFSRDSDLLEHMANKHKIADILKDKVCYPKEVDLKNDLRVRGHEIILEDSHRSHGISLVGTGRRLVETKVEEDNEEGGTKPEDKSEVWNIIKTVVQDDNQSEHDTEAEQVIYIKYQNQQDLDPNKTSKKDGSDMYPLSFADEYLKDLHNIPVTESG